MYPPPPPALWQGIGKSVDESGMKSSPDQNIRKAEAREEGGALLVTFLQELGLVKHLLGF
jgi:hypothetical protein